jgi:hypothetical protein
VTVTETVFTKRALAGELLVKNCIANLMKIEQTAISLMYCDRRTDRGLCYSRNNFSLKEPNNHALG